MVGHHVGRAPRLSERAPRLIDAARHSATGRVTLSVLYSGLIAVAVMGVLVFFVGIKPAGGEVAAEPAATVGDCVAITGSAGTGAPCDAAGMTFVVAQRVAAGAGCAAPSYLRLPGDDKGALCVAPNLTVGGCYATGPGFPATSDIRAVACPTGLGERSGAVIRVLERAIGGPLACPDRTAINFKLPQPFGYCVTTVV